MQKFLHLWYASGVHLMLLYIEGSFTQKEFREGARGSNVFDKRSRLNIGRER